MVVDTSALVAIMLLEPEAERFAKAIADARPRLISVANLLETWLVIESRLGPRAGGDVDEFVVDVGLGIEPVTPDQSRIARRAYRTYGKGNHPAGLDFGDCFAYALAKTTGLPLLFKGDDFGQTDVAPAADDQLRTFTVERPSDLQCMAVRRLAEARDWESLLPEALGQGGMPS